MHACMHACARACLPMRVCMRPCACVNSCVHVCVKSKRHRVGRKEVADAINGDGSLDDEPVFGDEEDNDDDNDWRPEYVSSHRTASVF